MKKFFLWISILFMTLLLVSCKTNKPDLNEKYAMELNNIYIDVANKKDIERDKWQNASLKIGDENTPIFESDSLRVRGRGNSTWYSVPEAYQKRPYRIRFDEDISILGMKPARDYVLLAEHFDRSLLRNYFSHRMSKDLHISYQNETRAIELYLNGTYHGYYTLTEQVEVHESRLNIDTSGTTGGFLIELESDERIGNEGIENIHWVRVRERNYVIKAPDMDKLTETEIKAKTSYIKDYLESVYLSLSTSNYETYVDIDAFIDYFILNEIAKQIDINWSSVYAYKDKSGKLMMGPIWDFDLGYGNANYGSKDNINFDSPTGFWMTGHQWYDQAMKNKYFRKRYVERFKEILNTHFDEWLYDLQEMYTLIADAGNRNFERWPILDVDMWPITKQALNLNSHEEHYNAFKDYLTQRKSWLLQNVSKLDYE